MGNPLSPKQMGQVISTARAYMGMSQSDLASALGVDRRTVSNWETGKTTPSVIDAAQLCKILRLPHRSLTEQYGPHAPGLNVPEQIGPVNPARYTKSGVVLMEDLSDDGLREIPDNPEPRRIVSDRPDQEPSIQTEGGPQNPVAVVLETPGRYQFVVDVVVKGPVPDRSEHEDVQKG